MKNLFAALICMASMSVNAQVLVYKGTQSSTFIRNGRSQIIPLSGNLLYDVASNRCIVIGVYIQNSVKKYRVTEKSNFTVGEVSGSAGLRYMVLEEVHDGSDGSRSSVYLKGLNTLLTVATGQQFTAPKTFTGQVRELYYNAGVLTAHEGSATAVYDQAATVKANNEGSSIDAVVSSISTALEGKGYVKNSDPLP